MQHSYNSTAHIQSAELTNSAVKFVVTGRTLLSLSEIIYIFLRRFTWQNLTVEFVQVETNN